MVDIKDINSLKTSIKSPRYVKNRVYMVASKEFFEKYIKKNGKDENRCYLDFTPTNNPNTTQRISFKYLETDKRVQLLFQKDVFNKLCINIDNIKWTPNKVKIKPTAFTFNSGLNIPRILDFDKSLYARLNEPNLFAGNSNCNNFIYNHYSLSDYSFQNYIPSISYRGEMSINIDGNIIKFGNKPIFILEDSLSIKSNGSRVSIQLEKICRWGVLLKNSHCLGLPVECIMPHSNLYLLVDKNGYVNDCWNKSYIPENKRIVYGRKFIEDGLSINPNKITIGSNKLSRYHGKIKKTRDSIEITTQKGSNPLVALINPEITICQTFQNMELTLVKLSKNVIINRYDIEIRHNTLN